MESKIFSDGKCVMDGPFLRKIKKFPLPAALGAAVIMSVHALPARFLFGGIPDDLWIRSYQDIPVPALQLFTLGAVDYFIVVPSIC